MNGLKVQRMMLLKALLNEKYRRPGDMVVFTDGSVVLGTKSAWAFSARDGDMTVSVREMSGATEVTTSSMYMESPSLNHSSGSRTQNLNQLQPSLTL